jgi:hypothetical protein
MSLCEKSRSFVGRGFSHDLEAVITPALAAEAPALPSW